jgi:ribosomal-protein-alanine N-acetyltransferase
MERRIVRRGEHSEDEAEQFLISATGKDEPMGVVGYFSPFANKKTFKGVELYYVIHPDFRRSRIATQAVCLVVNHLFDATPIERIQATVIVGNEHSCRVLRRAGMKKEGTYRRVSFLHGEYSDMYLYSIVREDWGNESVYRKNRPEF